MDPVQLIAVPLEGIREDLVALRHLQEAALRVVIDRTLAVGGSPALGRNRSGLFLVVESLDLLVAELVPAGSVPLENPSATGGIGALGDIGCYSLDMVLNAVGYPKPLTVSGYTSNFFGTNPLYATPDGDAPEEGQADQIEIQVESIEDRRVVWAKIHVIRAGDQENE